MDISVFEIIGPVMIGPSSSGTGGMARLGKAANHFLDAPVKAIDLKFHPRFHHYPGLRSHYALIGGILGMDPRDPEIKNAMDIAKSKGITCTGSWIKPPYPKDAHTVLFTLTQIDGKVRTVLGASIGGGQIDVFEVDGFKVDLSCTEKHLFVWAERDITPELESLIPNNTGIKLSTNNDIMLHYMGVPADIDESVAEDIRKVEGVERVLFTEPFLELGFTPHKPLFSSCEELIRLSDESGKDISELAIEYEMQRSGRSRETIWNMMVENLNYMKTCTYNGIATVHNTLFGLGGGDAQRMQKAVDEGKTFGGSTLGRSIAKALGVMETGMSMDRVVAAPTGGSAGIVPGTFLTIQEDTGCSDEQLIRALFTAAALGVIMFSRDCNFSGQAGGCQGEVGVSSAIAAAGLAYLGGGSPRMCCEAMALSLKNMLGLICDPIGNCTEVPCIKRNGIGVSNAFVGCDMALAGIVSRVSPDHVIDALHNTQMHLPTVLRGGAGGLCCTPESDEYAKTTDKINKDLLLTPSNE